MKRLIAIVTVSLIASLAGLVPVEARTTAAPQTRPDHSVATHAKVRTIAGTVGPGFIISMARKRTHTGMYTITIHDKSSIHNFHLTGPGGVDRRTGVGFIGTRTWSVRLRAGTYRFQCDVHPDMMHGTLIAFTG